ncbi:hypothetical protein EMCRGX_G009343 [Ephydatia muelleri]
MVFYLKPWKLLLASNVDPDDKQKTAFSTPFETYQFKFNMEFTVDCDARLDGLGAVLSLKKMTALPLGPPILTSHRSQCTQMAEEISKTHMGRQCGASEGEDRCSIKTALAQATEFDLAIWLPCLTSIQIKQHFSSCPGQGLY